MLHLCETELLDLDMSLNDKESVCMRFGPQFNATCAKLSKLATTCLHAFAFAVISAFTVQVLELLNVVLTIIVRLVFTAHLTQFTIVFVALLRLK